MSDEQKPTEPESVQSSVEGKKAHPRSKLDNLPPEILKEVDSSILSGKVLKYIRNEMIQKYPNVEGLKASYVVWSKRAFRLRVSTKDAKEESLVKKGFVEALPTTEALQNAVSTVISNPTVSLSDRRAALESLFSKVIEQMARVEDQKKHYLNPDFEIVYINYMKLYKEIIESVNKAQVAFNRDITADMLRQMDQHIEQMFNLAYKAYTKTHLHGASDDKFDSFRIEFEELIANYFKTLETSQIVSKN
jgi:hypothetical protein